MSAVPASTSSPFESDTDARGAYVLKLRLARSITRQIEFAECPGLAAETVSKLVDVIARSRDRRDKDGRLRNAARELGLPGLAVVSTFAKEKYQFDVPPPLEMPFEPMELSEAHPAIAAMAESIVSDSMSQLDKGMAPKWGLSRWLIRVGAPSIVMLNIGIQAVVRTIADIAMYGFRSSVLAMWLVILGVTVGACMFAVWRNSAQWFIIPGGVVIRRAVGRRFANRLYRFTPGDALLALAPDNMGWNAVLVGDSQRFQIRLTKREAVVLLGAWQSPLPAPALEQMVDLQ